MYIRVFENDTHNYPYSISDLKKDFPDVSFPSEISEELLAEFDVYPVVINQAPQLDYTQFASPSASYANGSWVIDWIVTNIDPIEAASIGKSLREEAYRNESDPLFFKFQRGEATEQQWIDKVNEIKARYPI